ncbi:MAG TPA: YkvA family protein [Micromonosporaceae bacterium]|nr:YkvA family protein [Micromonosporaceae bacterium]
MAKTLKRAAAFRALARALFSGARGGPSLGKRLGAFPRMIKATLRREYDGGLRLTMMAAALVYVISPIDLMPELFLAVFGLGDDMFVVTWLAGSVLAETERFLQWEARGAATIPGEVLH